MGLGLGNLDGASLDPGLGFKLGTTDGTNMKETLWNALTKILKRVGKWKPIW